MKEMHPDGKPSKQTNKQKKEAEEDVEDEDEEQQGRLRWHQYQVQQSITISVKYFVFISVSAYNSHTGNWHTRPLSPTPTHAQNVIITDKLQQQQQK